jgi:hypothetical protein
MLEATAEQVRYRRRQRHAVVVRVLVGRGLQFLAHSRVLRQRPGVVEVWPIGPLKPPCVSFADGAPGTVVGPDRSSAIRRPSRHVEIRGQSWHRNRYRSGSLAGCGRSRYLPKTCAGLQIDDECLVLIDSGDLVKCGRSARPDLQRETVLHLASIPARIGHVQSSAAALDA